MPITKSDNDQLTSMRLVALVTGASRGIDRYEPLLASGRLAMDTKFSSDIAFTPSVKTVQAGRGSRKAYAEFEARAASVHRSRPTLSLCFPRSTRRTWRPLMPRASPMPSTGALHPCVR